VTDFFYRRLTLFDDSDQQLADHLSNQTIEEVYFDSPEFSLLQARDELYTRTVTQTPKSSNLVKQVVFVDYNPENSVTSHYNFETQSYRRRNTPLESHPLFGIVKRRQRNVLLDKLSSYGSDFSGGIIPVLTVVHNIASHSFQVFRESGARIAIDHTAVYSHSLYKQFVVVRFELYEDAKSSLNAREKQTVLAALTGLHCEFQSLFPGLQAKKNLGYSDYQRFAERLLPLRSIFIRYPMLFKGSQAIVLAVVGFLLLYLIIGRRNPKPSFRYSLKVTAKRDD